MNEIKGVFSSFYLNDLIHQSFLQHNKYKIKIKHRNKCYKKISHLSQNKQGITAT